MPVQKRSQSAPKKTPTTQPAKDIAQVLDTHANRTTKKRIAGRAPSTARSSKATKQQCRSLTEQGSCLQGKESPSAKEHESFPFLSLPPEIRVMVMRYYFGSHDIHIIPQKHWPAITAKPRVGPPTKLDHRVCILGSECSTRRQINHAWHQIHGNHRVKYDELHRGCNLMGWRYRHEEPLNMERVNIDLLFVNMQIFQEASDILYGTQTFIFTDRKHLTMFCNLMAETQKRTLRKVEIITEARLCREEDGPKDVIGPYCLRAWPEEVLPALRSITNLRLTLRIEVLGLTLPCECQVAKGPVQALHKAVRWHFGFLRKLENLQNVVVNIQDPGRLVDPEYLPIIISAFKAELVSPFGPDFIQADQDEESWREDIMNGTSTLSENAYKRDLLSQDLEACRSYYSEAQRNVEQQTKAIERLRARSKEPSEIQKAELTIEQRMVGLADTDVKRFEEQLTAAEALDRGAIEERVRILQGKIATQEASVYQYIRDFEASRGRDESGNA